MIDDKADVKSLVKTALSQESCGPWLLIVDNADDAEILFGEKGLNDYLPHSRKGSILFTTRTTNIITKLDIPPKDCFKTIALGFEEAIEMLEKNLKQDQIKDSDSTIELLDLLQCLPLAIKQASAYMTRMQWPTVKYLEHCRSSDERFMKLLSENMEFRGRPQGTSNAIATTWLISFEHISGSATGC
jgi:hypothetical protein